MGRIVYLRPDMFNISPPTSLSCCATPDSLNSFLRDTGHYSDAATTIYIRTAPFSAWAADEGRF